MKAPSSGQLAKQKADEERLEKARTAAAVKVGAGARRKGRRRRWRERAKYPCACARERRRRELWRLPVRPQGGAQGVSVREEHGGAGAGEARQRARERVQKEKVACRSMWSTWSRPTWRVHLRRKKDDHTAEALAAGTKGGPKHGERDSAGVRASPKEFVECKKYVVNMESANFGECICGAKRDPQPRGARGGDPKHGQRNSADARGLLQKEYCACKKYVVNMESANFGECVCSEPRDHHNPEALGNATKGGPKPAQLGGRARGLLQKETVSCTNFVLDMSPDALFGQCATAASAEWPPTPRSGARRPTSARQERSPRASKYTRRTSSRWPSRRSRRSASRTRRRSRGRRIESSVLASCGPAVQIDRARGCGAPDGHRDSVFRFSYFI